MERPIITSYFESLSCRVKPKPGIPKVMKQLEDQDKMVMEEEIEGIRDLGLGLSQSTLVN